MKEAYYFSHDYNATSDPKISALIEKFNAEGYGIYWHIIELLHQEENHYLPLEEYMFLAIAKQMKANAETVQNLIEHCINVCKLFFSEDNNFSSHRVLRNFEQRTSLSEKRRNSGKLGAIAKQTAASAQQTPAKSSKGKERKGNIYNTGSANAGLLDTFPQVINIAGKAIPKSYLSKLYTTTLKGDFHQMCLILFRSSTSNDPIAYIEKGVKDGYIYEASKTEYESPLFVQAWIDSLCGIDTQPTPKTTNRNSDPDSISTIVSNLIPKQEGC
jgi:hypothetical protein